MKTDDKKRERITSRHRAMARDGVRYFRTSRDEIAKYNLALAKPMSVIFLLALIIYSVVIRIIGSTPLADVMFIVFITLQVLLIAWIFSLSAVCGGVPPTVVSVTVSLFGFLIFLFTLIISVFAFPDKPSVFFPTIIMCLAVLYIYPLRTVLLRITAYEVIYLVMALIFKDRSIFSVDFCSSTSAWTVAIVAATVIYDLRLRDFRMRLNLRRQSMTDTLTGLYNKTASEALCSVYLRGAPSCALMIIDIDNFKLVNDSYGHQRGDAILREIASVMRDTFCDYDLLGRFGGDELLVFTRRADSLPLADDARRFCEAINSVRTSAPQLWHTPIGAKNNDSDDGVRLSCSIGIAVSCKDEDYVSLFARADRELYAVKNNGKNGYSIKYNMR